MDPAELITAKPKVIWSCFSRSSYVTRSRSLEGLAFYQPRSPVRGTARHKTIFDSGDFLPSADPKMICDKDKIGMGRFKSGGGVKETCETKETER